MSLGPTRQPLSSHDALARLVAAAEKVCAREIDMIRGDVGPSGSVTSWTGRAQRAAALQQAIDDAKKTLSLPLSKRAVKVSQGSTNS